MMNVTMKAIRCGNLTLQCKKVKHMAKLNITVGVIKDVWHVVWTSYYKLYTTSTKLKPVCPNCWENHPTSYHGCIVAKELQKWTDNMIKNKKEQLAQCITFTSKKATCEVSYVGVVWNWIVRRDVINWNDEKYIDDLMGMKKILSSFF